MSACAILGSWGTCAEVDVLYFVGAIALRVERERQTRILVQVVWAIFATAAIWSTASPYRAH
jgi:hypothetical protein